MAVVDVTSDAETLPDTFHFACPICQTTQFSMSAMPRRVSGLCCSRCNRTFDSKPEFIDLTLTSGYKSKAFSKTEWGGTELFRSPLISFVYERGWRQGFSWAGFPGVDKEVRRITGPPPKPSGIPPPLPLIRLFCIPELAHEPSPSLQFDLAMDYLEPVISAASPLQPVIVDMSCGSGLFTRRFAKSGKFSGVIAADFSESMLLQTREYLKEDGSLGGKTPITLLRCDVARLPFETGSVQAIHAGAGIHCWPNPQAALAEISRVLAPGGIFIASTFLVGSAPLGEAFGNDSLFKPLNQLDKALVSRQYTWWEEEELRDLSASVGLEKFERTRQWRFILFKVQKPAL